jgi:hypothetical protein
MHGRSDTRRSVLQLVEAQAVANPALTLQEGGRRG